MLDLFPFDARFLEFTHPLLALDWQVQGAAGVGGGRFDLRQVHTNAVTATYAVIVMTLKRNTSAIAPIIAAITAAIVPPLLSE